MKIYSVILLLLLTYAIWVFSIAMQHFEYSAYAGDKANISEFTPQTMQFKFKYSEGEKYLQSMGLVDVQTIHPEIKVNLAYATSANFTGQILYPDIKRAFLQPTIAEKLAKAQDYLAAIDSNYSILVLDAVRPRYVQRNMWTWAVENNLTKYVAAPTLGSVHNYGCAVDVTIMAKDSLLDMGTAYDYFGPEAEPRYNLKLYKEGVLTKEHLMNRALLKDVMRKAGFRTIQTEWWHYNGVSKENARRYFKIIE